MKQSNSLHVLLTTDIVGGVWDFSWSLAGELVWLGHQVTLLAFGEPSAGQRRQADAAGAWLVSAPLKLEWMQDSAADVQASRALTARLVEELEPDVVHANQFAVAALEGRVPVVLTAHGDVLSWRRWVLGEEGDRLLQPEWAAYAELVRAGLVAADEVVAISRFLGEQVRELYRLDRSPHVIHNGWPAGDGPAPRPVAERERLTVLAGRAWDAAKNICLAAEVAHRWPKAGRVVLAGDQRHPESGAIVHLPPPVEPLGYVKRERLDAYLRRARAYVSAARYDPFGLLPLQAALAGCPLLLGDIPSYRELWEGAALFFPPDDATRLRGAWERLLDDEELAGGLAATARERALSRFSARRMADDYLALYRAAIARRQAGAPGPPHAGALV